MASEPGTRSLPRVVVLVLAVAGIACGGSNDPKAPSTTARTAVVVDDLDAPLDRLSDAVTAARPSRRGSLVTLRASADRAKTALRRAKGDLREIEDSATLEERRPVRETADALADLDQLVSALGVDRLSVNDLEVDGERAQQAVDDARLDLPAIDTSRLASAVRRSRKRARPAATTSTGAPASPAATPGRERDAGPSDPASPPMFQTGTDSGQAVPAAVCRFTPPSSGAGVYCWTPNDGYTVAVDQAGARRVRGDEQANRGVSPSSYAELPIGGGRTGYGYSCQSGAGGLTCSGPSGRGWTLPRYRGLARFF